MLDLILFVLILAGFLRGWMKGFLAQLISLVGAIAGFLVACMLYGSLGDVLAPQIGTSPTLGHVVAFFLIWVCVPLLGTLASKFLGGVLNKIKLGWVNSILGGTLGASKMLLFLSVILSFLEFIDQYKKEPFIAQDVKAKSILYYPVQKAGGKILPSHFLEKTTSDSTENGAV